MGLELLESTLKVGFYGYLFYLSRNSLKNINLEKLTGMFEMGKSKAKIFKMDSSVKIRFDDVAGCDEAKIEV